MDSSQATPWFLRPSIPLDQAYYPSGMYYPNSEQQEQQQQSQNYTEESAYLNHQSTTPLHNSSTEYNYHHQQHQPQQQNLTEESAYLNDNTITTNTNNNEQDTANDAYAHLYPPSTPLSPEELRSYTFFCAPPHFLHQYNSLNPVNDEFIINASYVGDGIWRGQIVYAPAVGYSKSEVEEYGDEEMDEETDEEEAETDVEDEVVYFYDQRGRGRLLTPEYDLDPADDPHEVIYGGS